MQLVSRGTLGALTLALTLSPAPATAQFGKLVKKAKEAAGIDKPVGTAAGSAQAPAGPVRVNPAFELTAANLDRFTTALAAERVGRQEQLKIIASIKSPAVYATCSQNVAMSPGYQKIYNSYLENSPKATTPEAMNDVAKKFAEDAAAYMTAKCGANPGGYPESQRESMVRSKGYAAGLERSGLDGRTYAVLKERIIPFCSADAATRAAADVRIPGQGRNIYFVYLPSETANLAPRCDALLAALQAVS
ncbi:MAG: hypothetical protein V4558_03500 [Gemmatimonadota bacterium]